MEIHLPDGYPLQTIKLEVKVPTLRSEDIKEVYPHPMDARQITLNIRGELYWFKCDPNWGELMQAPVSYGSIHHLESAVMVLKVEPKEFSDESILALKLVKAYWVYCSFGC